MLTQILATLWKTEFTFIYKYVHFYIDDRTEMSNIMNKKAITFKVSYNAEGDTTTKVSHEEKFYYNCVDVKSSLTFHNIDESPAMNPSYLHTKLMVSSMKYGYKITITFVETDYSTAVNGLSGYYETGYKFDNSVNVYCKELIDEKFALKTQVEELQTKIASLETRLAALEAK